MPLQCSTRQVDISRQLAGQQNLLRHIARWRRRFPLAAKATGSNPDGGKGAQGASTGLDLPRACLLTYLLTMFPAPFPYLLPELQVLRCVSAATTCGLPPGGMLDETAVYELQQLCTGGGLTQDSLSRLIDAGLSVQSLVRSDAAAMAQAKKAGLGMAERQALKEALRQHRDEVRSLPTTWNAPAGCNASQHALPHFAHAHARDSASSRHSAAAYSPGALLRGAADRRGGRRRGGARAPLSAHMRLGCCGRSLSAA